MKPLITRVHVANRTDTTLDLDIHLQNREVVNLHLNAEGAAADRNALLVGAGLNARLLGNLSAHLDYNATLRADTGVRQFLSAAVSYAW